MPQRIQRKRVKGWKMPPNAKSVTRPGPYGNPYRVGIHGTAEQCVEKFRMDWERAIRCAKRDHTPYMPFGKPVYLGPLKGKDLACYCSLDQPCHADVLLEIVAAHT